MSKQTDAFDHITSTLSCDHITAEKDVREHDIHLRSDGTLPHSAIITGLLHVTRELIARNDQVGRWYKRGIDYTIRALDVAPYREASIGDRVSYAAHRSPDSESDETTFHCCASVNGEAILLIDFAFLIARSP